MTDDLDGMAVFVAVPARVLSTHAALNLRLVRAGMGLTIVYEDQVGDDLARGELVPVLEAFSTPFPGYYLYHQQRRQAAPPLRALVDFVRQAARTTRATRATRARRR